MLLVSENEWREWKPEKKKKKKKKIREKDENESSNAISPAGNGIKAPIIFINQKCKKKK